MQVLLLPAMRHVLSRYDSTFRPWDYRTFAPAFKVLEPWCPHECLFGVIGDFNGDGRLDVALNGYARHASGVTVVILSTDSGYRVVELNRFEDEPNLRPGESVEWMQAVTPHRVGLNVWAPDDEWAVLEDTVPGKPNERTLLVEHDAFSINEADGGSVLWLFARGRFWRVMTGD